MIVYKTCFDGNWCVFSELEGAKEMFLTDIEYDENITDEEFYNHRKIVESLDYDKLLVSPYKASGFILEIGEMDEEEHNNLMEFKGY